MKLIQILALATAMATVATAQNSGANSQPKASPTPTPAAASKTGSTTKPAAKKTASGKKSDAKKAAKTSNSNAASPKADPAPKGGTASTASTKPVVKTSTGPVKPLSPAGTQAKGGAPTPVVAAKDGSKPAAKKTDAKKTEAKKAPVKAPAKRPAKTPAVIAVKPAPPAKKTGTQTKTAAKPAVAVPPKAPAPGTTQKAQAAEKPKPTVRPFGAHGRRDPFVSPIVSKDGISRPAPNCTSGKRCLVIPELVLQGTVKDTSGKMMAVVANSIKKTYFLRENDQVFQGSVEKITSDSIIFREYVKDALGRETAREVVKKLVPTS
jgi:Tfp pilus assembly protein PilP